MKQRSPRFSKGALGLPFALLPFALVGGCGGTDADPLDRDEIEQVDTGPRTPPDCSADDGLEMLVVDDFELGAASTAFTNNEICDPCLDLSGEDLLVCQDRCIASQTPTDLDKPLPAELIPEGRCESSYALHVTTTQFRKWGGLVGFRFSPALDARDYDGVAFWGRVAWGTRSSLRATALDPETDATFIDPDSGVPRCDGESDLDEFAEACDPYGAFAVMTGDWQFFRIPFSEMRQRGFGHVAPFLDLGAILQVSIEYGIGEWDFWIDDIALYRTAENDR